MGFDILAAVMAVFAILSFGAIAPADMTGEPGSELIAGSWSGSASIPFMASVTFKAEVENDGTAEFSGTVSSKLFGNHIFNTQATWAYQGETSFDTEISGVHTQVTCDGKTLTFPINPYRLGLVDNPIADQNFIIDLHRI